MAAKLSLTLPNGQKMPALGLGTWQASDEKELETALNKALEVGYRHIDTAFIYRNEAIIGKVLKKWFSSGKIKREDLFITTKLPPTGIHPDRVEMFMKKSLEALQLDYVDLYLIHFSVGAKYQEGSVLPPTNEKGETLFEPKTDHVGVWKKMEEQVDAGRTKNIGLSNFNIAQIENVLKSARIKPANLQVELHLYLQQRNLIDFCHKNAITVVAYSPLGNPSYNTFLERMGQPRKKLMSIMENATVKKIAAKHGKTAAQVALRFLLQYGVGVIPKSISEKRLEENISVFDFSLSDGEMKVLHDLEVGEPARISDFRVFAGVEKHPDYPFK